jgi:RNA polymerase sigma-70 factor (ECF subfamily)
MMQLELEYNRVGKQALFHRLKVFLGGVVQSMHYSQVATELDMSEEAVKMAVYRLRKRYRDLLRNEIAQTVATQEQVDEEIQDLFEALGD